MTALTGSNQIDFFRVSVPEPSTLALLCVGLAGLHLGGRRRRPVQERCVLADAGKCR